MKRSMLLCLLFIFIKQACFCQAQYKDSLFFRANRIYKNDTLVNMAELRTLLAKNDAASYELQRGLGNQTGTSVCGFIGGFLIGYPLGQAIFSKSINNKPKWYLLGIGAGFVGIGAALNATANSNFRDAVKYYNEGLKNAYRKNKTPIQLNFAFNLNGIRVSAKF